MACAQLRAVLYSHHRPSLRVSPFIILCTSCVCITVQGQLLPRLGVGRNGARRRHQLPPQRPPRPHPVTDRGAGRVRRGNPAAAALRSHGGGGAGPAQDGADAGALGAGAGDDRRGGRRGPGVGRRLSGPAPRRRRAPRRRHERLFHLLCRPRGGSRRRRALRRWVPLPPRLGLLRRHRRVLLRSARRQPRRHHLRVGVTNWLPLPLIPSSTIA